MVQKMHIIKVLANPTPCGTGPWSRLTSCCSSVGSRGNSLGTPERPGLARLLTVHGEGSININTAPKEVLRALAPSISEDAANRMDDYRRNPANNLTDPSWYRRVAGLNNTAIDSMTAVTKSDFFQIAAIGHLGTMKRTIRGIVKRDSEKKISVVAWRLG